MKLLRTFFLLLLCAMLPLSGLAASGLTGACPMQMSYAGDEGAMAGEMPDCDFMKAPTSVKIKAPFCKATAVCQLGSLYHPVSELAVTGPITSSDSVSDVYIDVLRVRAPDGPWRPPTSL